MTNILISGIIKLESKGGIKMTNFLLGMLATYLLLNIAFIIYIVITEWQDFWNLKRNKIKIFLLVLSMFFIGLPFAIMNKDSF